MGEGMSVRNSRADWAPSTGGTFGVSMGGGERGRREGDGLFNTRVQKDSL